MGQTSPIFIFFDSDQDDFRKSRDKQADSNAQTPTESHDLSGIAVRRALGTFTDPGGKYQSGHGDLSNVRYPKRQGERTAYDVVPATKRVYRWACIAHHFTGRDNLFKVRVIASEPPVIVAPNKFRMVRDGCAYDCIDRGWFAR
jgi:hypothetical protein